MKIRPTAIPDVLVVEPRIFKDDRGFFMETWETRKFAHHGITANFTQDNHSASTRHVLRGLHYQIRHPQGKLVRVIAGEVFDVAVDMRRSSPTFGRWVGAYLSADNHRMLWVPPGFAHGFVVLSERAEFVYKVSDVYCPEAERAVLWSDRSLGIAWPLPRNSVPILSPKDERAPPFALAETYA